MISMASLQSFNGYERRHGWRYGLSIQLVIQACMLELPFIENSIDPFFGITVRAAIAQDFLSQSCHSVWFGFSEHGGIKYPIQFPSLVGRVFHLLSARLNQKKESEGGASRN